MVSFLIQCNHENDNPCDGIAPPNEWGEFVVLNNEGISLVGKDRIYHPDSVNLFSLNQYVHWNILYDSVFVFDYSSFISSDVYYLRFNSTDIDTITIKFKLIEDICFTYQRIDTFSVNGTIIENNEGYFRLIKK